ncbi:M56 family metallopeptidase [Ferruginibacter paludis]|uniref:M56 family metallopeptidase n=1 Tax=Ferruginibacter paludis TaxID=1310417 RepID=UPI0025B62802|nr:M56 family metallopeptidase [Ferruginibacter paludis]MDN3656436.1 M56 family metallopeptidase [Ferruginibacter paludis]
MQSLLLYLFKLSISLAVVYSFYLLVLRRTTFYNCNRWYLLAYTACCFYIPFIDVSSMQVWHSLKNSEIVTTIPYFNFNAVSNKPAVASSWAETWLPAIVQIILLLGALLLLLRLLIQYVSFIRLKRKAILINDERVKIYSVAKNIIPFSIGNAIFIQHDLQDSDGLKEIIRHEFVHVQQKHTIDILFIEILCVVNWYNPFAWLIRHAVRQNLEFIADNKIVQTGFDKKQYQYLLLKVMGSAQFSFAQQFNFSSLKKRIIMMNKIKTARIQLARFLFVLPVAAMLLLAFRQHHTEPEAIALKPQQTRLSVDTVPASGGITPANVRSVNVQNHRATVTLKNGKVEEYDLNNANAKSTFTKKYGELPAPPPPPAAPDAPEPAIAPVAPIAPVPSVVPVAPAPEIAPVAPLPPPPPPPPPHPAHGKETVKTPGNVPSPAVDKVVDSKISESAAAGQTEAAKNHIVNVTMQEDKASQGDSAPGKALYVIDGKDVTNDVFNLLDKDLIMSINVLKGNHATKQYGEKGKNGVIEITTKKINN